MMKNNSLILLGGLICFFSAVSAVDLPALPALPPLPSLEPAPLTISPVAAAAQAPVLAPAVESVKIAEVSKAVEPVKLEANVDVKRDVVGVQPEEQKKRSSFGSGADEEDIVDINAFEQQQDPDDQPSQARIRKIGGVMPVQALRDVLRDVRRVGSRVWAIEQKILSIKRRYGTKDQDMSAKPVQQRSSIEADDNQSQVMFKVSSPEVIRQRRINTSGPVS